MELVGGDTAPLEERAEAHASGGGHAKGGGGGLDGQLGRQLGRRGEVAPSSVLEERGEA